MKNTKSEIINSAIAVIAKNGLGSSPVSLIAKEAEISVGLIYRYFTGKEELILSIYQDILSDIDLILDKKYQQEKSLKKQMKKRWEGVFNYLCDNPLKASYLNEFNSSVYVKKLQNDICDFCSFEDLVEKEAVRIEIKEFSPKLLLNFFKGTLFGAFTKAVQDDMMDRETIKEEMFALFWDGIRK